MKKTIYVSCFLVLMLALYTIFGTNTSGVKVGVVLPLTGKFAAISEDIQNAILLAKENSGNTEIEFVFEDSGGEPQKAVSAITHLIVNKKVKMVIAGTGSTANIAMAKVANEYGVPFFAVTSTPELMGKVDYVFTLQPSVIREVDTMVDYVRGQNVKKVAVLYDGSSDSLTVGAKHFRDYVGIPTAIFESYGSDADQNTVNLKIKSENPDLVYILGVDKAVGPIVKKLREIGYGGKITGFSGIESEVFLSSTGSSSEGVVLTSVPFSCEKEASLYCTQFTQKYSRLPQQYGAFVYDLVKNTLRDNCIIGVQSDCFVTSEYKNTITTGFGFTESGDLREELKIIIKRVVGGKFVDVK